MEDKKVHALEALSFVLKEAAWKTGGRESRGNHHRRDLERIRATSSNCNPTRGFATICIRRVVVRRRPADSVDNLSGTRLSSIDM